MCFVWPMSGYVPFGSGVSTLNALISGEWQANLKLIGGSLSDLGDLIGVSPQPATNVSNDKVEFLAC